MTRDNGTKRNKHGGCRAAQLEVAKKSLGCSVRGEPGAASEPPGAGETKASGVCRMKCPRGETYTGCPGFP